jgi:DNA-binding CsgD family transcriptional regulator
MRSPEAKLKREETLKARAERVLALRATGLQWTEIARRLGISARAARFAVTRLEP